MMTDAITKLLNDLLWISLAAYAFYLAHSYSMKRLEIFGPRLVSIETRIEKLEECKDE